MFSVVIPLHNKAPYIKRAMDSVLKQTYQNFEIIVINDGSTDGSEEIVKEIADARIKIFKQENSGVSVARNKGIKESKNEFIAFLDADDEWYCDYLETISNLYKEYIGCGAYATNYYVDSNNLNVDRTRNNTIPKGILKNYFKQVSEYPPFNSSSIVINKNVFYSVGYFDERLKMGEDLHMWFRVANNFKIAYSPKKLCIYHDEANNRACNDKDHLINDSKFIQSIEDMTGIIEKDRLYDYLELINKTRIEIAARYLKFGDKKQGKQLLQNARDTRRYKARWLKWFALSILPIPIEKYLFNLKEISNK